MGAVGSKPRGGPVTSLPEQSSAIGKNGCRGGEAALTRRREGSGVGYRLGQYRSKLQADRIYQ